jgi:hypothetical protein
VNFVSNFVLQFLSEKSIIFLAVIEDDHQVNNISNANGMGSKSMDSINSYDGSRNGLDDGADQGELEVMNFCNFFRLLFDFFR